MSTTKKKAAAPAKTCVKKVVQPPKKFVISLNPEDVAVSKLSDRALVAVVMSIAGGLLVRINTREAWAEQRAKDVGKCKPVVKSAPKAQKKIDASNKKLAAKKKK